MNLKLFSNMGIDLEYVLLVSVIMIVLLLLFIIVLFVKQSNLNKKYRQFMSGEDAISLEAVIKNRMDQISALEDASRQHENHISDIESILKLMFKKYGIVKYDAFQEMGGKLSFSLAMLNSNNDGYIINVIHSNRDGCFTYLKEITNGQTSVVLSDSEKEALDIALKSNSK